jgi:type VI secretion system secreted protein Hcp
VTITAVSHAGAEDQPYAESVSLKFAKVDLEYKPQRPDGSLDPGLHFTFDLKANKVG